MGKKSGKGEIENVEEAGGICVSEYQKEGTEEEVEGGVVRCCKLEWNYWYVNKRLSR